MTDERLNELLLNLYSCPLDRARWSGVLDQIRNQLGVRSAAVQVLTRRADGISVRWLARDRESEASPGHHDPFICGDPNPRLRCRADDPPYAQRMFMRDSDFAALGNTVALGRLHRALRNIGLGSFLSSRIGISSRDFLVLVLHRDVNDCRAFSGRDEAFIASVMPHLRQTIVLSEQFDAATRQLQDLQEAVDHISMGIALCDRESAPTWYNQTAARVFSARNCLWVSRGRLTAASAADTDKVRCLVARAASEESSPAQLTERCLLLGQSPAQDSLQVVAMPFRTKQSPHVCGSPRALDRTRALLFFSSPAAKALFPTDAVGRLFALSPAESRLTVALCNGQSVNDYAASHGVAVSTARFQLKQVLAKTQARRQSELVGRICMSVVAQAMRAGA